MSLVVIDPADLSALISKAVTDALRREREPAPAAEPLSLLPAARRAGVRTAVVRAAAESGDLPATRDHRGHWQILPADVDAWAKARP